MRPTTRTTVILLFAAWCIDFIDRTVIGVALPAIGDDLGLGHGQLGLVVSVFFLAYALAQLPGGLLADRFGAVRVAVAGLIAWSVFTGLTAAAMSFGALILIRILFGLAQGLFPSAAMKLLTERSTPEERMTANGWVNSSNAVGIVLAMVIAAALIPLLGWRGMFIAISVLGLAITVTFARRMPAPLYPADPTPPSRTTKALLRSPTMWLFSIAFFGYDIIVWGANAWAPSYLQEELGVSASASALLLLPAGLCAAASIIIAGRYSDRIGGRPRPLIVPGMSIATIGVLVLPHVPGVAGFVIVATITVTAAATAYIGAFSVPLKALAPTFSGVGAAMILMGGMVAGVVAPTLFGAIVDSSGWSAAWAALAVGGVISIVTTLFLPRDIEGFRRRVAPELLFTEPTAVTAGKA
ncbi:MFS transporter [Gordonia hydrophobica]|uniref:MFS transporter n=1 Tax=Gordonia hydrophobica TaxID=40516 RepID=A0ABZ2U2H8_9ACTN|nr:MFS transporter [Gordonia hydrophobica]MBM7366895.1 MFS family permease [Gordonia hydrophobica]